MDNDATRPSHRDVRPIMPVRRTLLALLLCTSAGWAAELRTLKQETITGDLVGISDKEIVIARGADKVTTPIDQALTAHLRPADRRPAQCALGGRGTDRRHATALRQVRGR